MTRARERLESLQRRFYDAVVCARGVTDAAASIVSDARASGEDRVLLYGAMYRRRLHDAIAADFPKLGAVLGPAELAAITDGYLQAFPPDTWSVRDVGARLATFLAQNGEPWRAELAALEWARVDVFDGPDAAVLTEEELRAMPPEAIPAMRLQLVPASARVRITFDVDALWSSLEDGEVGAPFPTRLPRARTILVWRRSAAVIHRTLEDDEAVAAELLARGASFSEACAALTGGADPPRRALELLLRWVRAEVLEAPRA